MRKFHKCSQTRRGVILTTLGKKSLMHTVIHNTVLFFMIGQAHVKWTIHPFIRVISCSIRMMRAIFPQCDQFKSNHLRAKNSGHLQYAYRCHTLAAFKMQHFVWGKLENEIGSCFPYTLAWNNDCILRWTRRDVFIQIIPFTKLTRMVVI